VRPRYWNSHSLPRWQQLAPQAGMYASMLIVAASALFTFYSSDHTNYLHAPVFAERGITVCVAGVLVLIGIVHASETIQSRRVRADLTRLLMTTSQLADANTPRDAIPQAVHELRMMVPSKSIAVYLMRKDGGYIRLNFAEGVKTPVESAVHMLAAPYAEALKGTTVVFGTHEVGNAELIVPLRTINVALGLVVMTGKPGYAYSSEQASLAQALTSQLALTIDSFRLRRVAADTAITDERNRLARELHDSVSQALFSIALGSRTARELVERKQNPAETLDYVVSLAEVALAEMRALVFELRPESMMQFGLLVALRGQLESLCERNHMTARIEVHCAEPEQSPAAFKESIYRIVMEAANNAVKHARASELALTIDSVGGQLIIELRDNGRGFDASGEFPGHLGLISMRERAQRQGGQLTIASAVGQGTAVRLQMPLVETSSELLR
jgi:signal transduction histidine kinase